MRGNGVLPVGQERIEDLPRAFRLVTAGEERGVAKNAIEQQRFVGIVTRRAEPLTCNSR